MASDADDIGCSAAFPFETLMRSTITRPKIARVREYVLNQLAVGTLSRGDALPTENELAKKLDVGRHSVREAIGELDRSGVVQRVQGKGTFVSMQSAPWADPANSGAAPANSKAEPAKKVNAYALVLPETIVSGFYPSLIRGFGQKARESRHESLMVETDGNLTTQGDVIFRLFHNNVSGVAIVPAGAPMPDHQLEVLRDHNIPVVFCHRHTANLNAPLVRWSWEEVGRIAAATLADLGHTKIALLSAAPIQALAPYVLGLQSELTRRGIAFPDSQIFSGKHFLHITAEQEWDEILTSVLDGPDRATAIFCCDESVSEHLYLAAMHRGLRVPEDLTILGVGPKWRDGALRTKLAAVTIDEIDLGRRAVQLLDEMREGTRPIDSNEVVTVPLELFAGSSLGPPPRKN